MWLTPSPVYFVWGNSHRRLQGIKWNYINSYTTYNFSTYSCFYFYTQFVIFYTLLATKYFWRVFMLAYTSFIAFPTVYYLLIIRLLYMDKRLFRICSVFLFKEGNRWIPVHSFINFRFRFAISKTALKDFFLRLLLIFIVVVQVLFFNLLVLPSMFLKLYLKKKWFT